MVESNKNWKQKKAESGKGNNRKNRNHKIIPEEESSPFEKDFEREHQEALEAFDFQTLFRMGTTQFLPV